MNRYKIKLIDIRLYRNQMFSLDILGIKRTLPLCRIENDIWLVVNDSLCFGCDVEFTWRVAEEMSKRVASFHPEVLLTPETKAIALSYEVTRQLRLPRYVLAKKSHKRCAEKVIATRVSSITTPMPQELFLDEHDVKYLRGKKVVLLDDVLSTGKTMQALMSLAVDAGAEVCAMAVVWLEGPWAFQVFADEFCKGKVVFLDVLPVYGRGNAYDQLRKEKEQVESKGLCQHIQAQRLL